MIRISLPAIIFSICLPLYSLSQRSSVASNYDVIAHNVAKLSSIIHFNQPVYDDSFSSTLFHSAFESLDPSKMIFTRHDIDMLSPFEYTLDDELNGRHIVFFRLLDSVYRQRVTETRKLVLDMLQLPANLESSSVYHPDRDSADFPLTLNDKMDVWLEYLTYEVLNRYEEISLADSLHDINAGIDTAMEKRARSYVATVQARYFDRLLNDTGEEDHFSGYMNTMIHLLDPHSEYFLPVEKRGFQENLSGIYYGIGALLQESAGKIKVAELMIGGPAWKSGQVEKGDEIIAVGQEMQAMQNVEGIGMREVIKLTRGKKGAKVNIVFRTASGKLKTVSLIRDALQLEDTFVRSAVINDSLRIGYIYLPKFYTSFDDKNGRSCADDIASELKKLKDENVQGIVIDIRDNGGGSLGEVIKMVGLFIKQGPVVQVKNPGKEPQVAAINNKEVLYSGPLVVLVNELSASASEIFAAAIQDYKRGLIVGSPSTFGKGSVQRAFKIPGAGFRPTDTDLGSIHLTWQKYYRINGGATQLKGITPDIILPGLYKIYNTQEKYFPNVLPWDTVSAAAYTLFADTLSFQEARSRGRQRLQNIAAFSEIDSSLEVLDRSEKMYPLTISSFHRQRSRMRQAVAEIRELASSGNPLEIKNTSDDLDELLKREQFRIDNNNAWLRRLKKDLYLGEAVRVVEDMIRAG